MITILTRQQWRKEIMDKIIKKGTYKITENKPNVIDDDGRLKTLYVSKSDVLRCLNPIKVGDYVQVRRPVLPKGTVVQSVHYDPMYRRGFLFTLWNMKFPVAKDGEFFPSFNEEFSWTECMYKIADQ